MEMIEGMRYQIITQLKKSKILPYKDFPFNKHGNNWSIVKAALTMGAYPNLARFEKEAQQLRTMKESKVRLHPSCEVLSSLKGIHQKVTASDNAKAISGQSSEWFIYDEMTKSGRNAMVKCVSPVSGLNVALFAGPITLEGIQNVTDSGNLYAEITEWLCFQGTEDTLGCVLDLRQKWFAQFLCLLEHPEEPIDEVSLHSLRFSRFHGNLVSIFRCF